MRHLQVTTLQANVGKMLSDLPDDDRSFSVLPGAARDTMIDSAIKKEATTLSLLIRRIPLEIFAI